MGNLSDPKPKVLSNLIGVDLDSAHPLDESAQPEAPVKKPINEDSDSRRKVCNNCKHLSEKEGLYCPVAEKKQVNNLANNCESFEGEEYEVGNSGVVGARPSTYSKDEAYTSEKPGAVKMFDLYAGRIQRVMDYAQLIKLDKRYRDDRSLTTQEKQKLRKMAMERLAEIDPTYKESASTAFEPLDLDEGAEGQPEEKGRSGPNAPYPCESEGVYLRWKFQGQYYERTFDDDQQAEEFIKKMNARKRPIQWKNVPSGLRSVAYGVGIDSEMDESKVNKLQEANDFVYIANDYDWHIVDIGKEYRDIPVGNTDGVTANLTIVDIRLDLNSPGLTVVEYDYELSNGKKGRESNRAGVFKSMVEDAYEDMKFRGDLKDTF